MTPGDKVIVETERNRPTPRLVAGVVVEVCERIIVVDCDDGIVRGVPREAVRV